MRELPVNLVQQLFALKGSDPSQVLGDALSIIDDKHRHIA